MSGHTKGPWHVTAPTDTLHAVRSENGIVADVGYSRTLEENDANARLIAAAPDLFELVETANHGSKGSHTTMWQERARAAIASAKGTV